MSEIYILHRQVSQYEDVEILGYLDDKFLADSWLDKNKEKYPEWSFYYKIVYPYRSK